MLGNPNYRPGSVHPFHRSLTITEGLYPGGPEDDDQQLAQGIEVEQVWEPPAPTLHKLSAVERASSLWEEREAGLNALTSSASGGPWASDPLTSREQLLAEIEDLTRVLKEKVARYSALRANQPHAEVGERANETAVMWIQDALEDIAATALGIEVASRELFLRSASAGERSSISDLDGQEQAAAE